jgi:Asp-tRNA(Asn)/Glu-tRNA(Gln) amidotransferase A subunit family amidase
MSAEPSPIAALLAQAAEPDYDLVSQVRVRLSRANGNEGRNTYIAFNPEFTLNEAHKLAHRLTSVSVRPPLAGLPVSLKDCFDLAGFATSSGSKFYATRRGLAQSNSAVASRLREAGAILTGKTHMHQIAYGLTGENPDYGDCLQPADSRLLTGGSSSGAAASIQEGSAVAAIGTDTGGSIRLPAAICGLAGYRSSLGVGDWTGGYHIAPSFDTIGWLFRDLRDAPTLAHALFRLPAGRPAVAQPAVGVLTGDLVARCDSIVRESLAEWQQRLARASTRVEPVSPSFWSLATDIYAPIQACEAAKLHAGFFRRFDSAIAARLEWGASIGENEIRVLRFGQKAFSRNMASLFERFDFLLAPATPVSGLLAGADHSGLRSAILAHTTPASVAGLPAVVLPSRHCGVQLMAARHDDRRLLAFSALLGNQLALEQS